MNYKIGEISKILDVPVETIRFYESKGLIHPQKDENSNYRYYDYWDINLLFDYKKYRDLEFSLAESLEIIQEASMDCFIDKLEDKIHEAEEKSRMYQLKMLKLQNYRNVLKNIPLIMGEYLIVNRPAGYYFINRWYRDGEFFYRTAEENEGCFDELLKHYVFVENIYKIRKERFESEIEEFEWGFTIKKEWADALKIKIDPKMTYIEPTESIYTIIQASDKEYFSSKMLSGVFSFMKDNGYELSGDILGNRLAAVQEEEGKKRFMEIWVPIKRME